MIIIEHKKIEDALLNISNRIGARFPNSNLYTLSKELKKTLDSINSKIIEVAKPKWSIRIVLTSFVILSVFLIFLFIKFFIKKNHDSDIYNIIQGVEAALNSFVLIGASFYFMFKLEERMKEKVILKQINNLRMHIHMIDMYQLGKDPLANPEMSTNFSNKNKLSNFEMGRYFNYCCELLSITSKMAVLFANENSSERISEAIYEIEILSSTLNRKIWQKIAMLDVNTKRKV
jgi:hypothetical protein